MLSLGLSLTSVAVRGGGGALSAAASDLASETNGLALSFTDDFFHTSTGHYGSARVKDTSTPANNYNSHPYGLLTYAGASKKWVRGPDGLLRESDPAVDLPYEWDVDGNPLGIRVEEQRTNLFTFSEQFDNAAWTKIANAGSISPNVTVAPNGEATADKLFEPTDGNTLFHGAFRACGDINGVVHTFSCFLRAAERTWARISYDGGGGKLAWFNLATGEVGTVQTGLSASIVPYAAGWFRCIITFTGAASGAIAIAQTTGNGVESTYAGVAGNGIYIWGAQLEAGSFPTSYIPTAGSTVTRAADVFGPPLAAFPWNGGVGTYEVDGVAETPTNNGTILTLAARSGQTHIRTVKWVPSP